MLYKYLSPARLSVLNDFKIRYTQPAQLNDPFESALLINTSAYDRSHEIIESLAHEVVCETDEDRAELEAAKDELKAEAKAKASPRAMGKRLAEFLNKARGVLSLSRANDSLLMWAHYGDSHRGFVIGVDETHPFFHSLDGEGNRTSPQNVIYTSRRMIVDVDSPEFHNQLLCYKSLEWAYEQEVRVFTTFGPVDTDFEKHAPDQVHLFTLPRECIKEIYIGANANAQTRAKILELVDRRKLQVKVFDAYVDDEKYALNFYEVSGQLHSYRQFGEPYVRAEGNSAKHSDTHFAFNGLPVLITVEYAPGVVHPYYATRT